MKALITVAALLVVLGVGLLLYSSPAAPPEMTEAEIARIEAEAKQAVMETLEAYQATMNPDIDVDTWLSFFAPDARLLGPGTDMTGSDLPAYVGDFLGSGAQVGSLDGETFDLWVHGDVAYQFGEYDEEYLFPGGDRVVVQGYVFQRWVKQPDGTWKIHRTLFSPRDAPPEG